MTRKREIRLSVAIRMANLLNTQSDLIWAYCRRHRDDLDSERHCAAIRGALENVITTMRDQVDSITNDLKKARKELAALRKFAAKVRREETEQ